MNLASGEGYSVLDVINEVELVTNKKIKYKFVDRRKGDPESLYATSNNILDYKNNYSDLNSIIKSMWNVYKG